MEPTYVLCRSCGTITDADKISFTNACCPKCSSRYLTTTLPPEDVTA